MSGSGNGSGGGNGSGSGSGNNKNNSIFFKNMSETDNAIGAVLVWDLDKTLVAKYFNVDKNSEIVDPIINTNALRIMHAAFKSQHFSANVMLTNNGNLKFINFVLFLMTNTYNEMFPEDKVGFLFSVIYTSARNPGGSYKDPRVIDPSKPESNKDPRYVAKRLEDVKNMLEEGELSATNLRERVFFFDDNTGHQMVTKGEIPGKNFIQIEPPFNTVSEDYTNYSEVVEFLELSEDEKQELRDKVVKIDPVPTHSYRNLADAVNMRRRMRTSKNQSNQSGGRKTMRKNRNEFRRTRRL